MQNKSLVENVDEYNIQNLINKFSDLEFSKHYDFSAEVTCAIADADSLGEFIKSNKPIKFNFNESNNVYYVEDKEAEEKLFEIDVNASFSKSDSWLYNKIIPVSNVFPNAVSVTLSDEMTSL